MTNHSTVLGNAAATLKDMIARKRRAGRSKRAAAIIAAMLGLALSTSPAFAWWDKDWGSRKQITLDTSANAGSVDGAVSNFPVLLRLDSSSFNFDEAAASGADLRFVSDDDKTVLPAHIESFNAKDGLATIWVAVPGLPAGGQQKIWMYFGNKKAAAADAQTLDPLYKAVYHFGAGENVATDATPAHANGSAVPHEHAGWIGEAASFNGTTTLNLPALSIDPNQGFSFEAWVKPATGNGTLYSNGDLTITLENGVPFVAVGGTKSSAVPAIAPVGATSPSPATPKASPSMLTAFRPPP